MSEEPKKPEEPKTPEQTAEEAERAQIKHLISRYEDMCIALIDCQEPAIQLVDALKKAVGAGFGYHLRNTAKVLEVATSIVSALIDGADKVHEKIDELKAEERALDGAATGIDLWQSQPQAAKDFVLKWIDPLRKETTYADAFEAAIQVLEEAAEKKDE